MFQPRHLPLARKCDPEAWLGALRRPVGCASFSPLFLLPSRKLLPQQPFKGISADWRDCSCCGAHVYRSDGTLPVPLRSRDHQLYPPRQFPPRLPVFLAVCLLTSDDAHAVRGLACLPRCFPDSFLHSVPLSPPHVFLEGLLCLPRLPARRYSTRILACRRLFPRSPL